MIKPLLVHIQQVQSLIRHVLADDTGTAHFGKVPYPAQQAVGDSGGAAGAAGDLARAAVIHLQTKNGGRTRHDGCQVGNRIEFQPLHNAEAVAQRVGQHPGSGGGPDQGKGRQIQLDRTGSRAFADHDIELIIFHRRIQNLFDDRRQAMNLVNEEHIARLEIGQQCSQVTGALQHRSGGALDLGTHLLGDDIGQRGLAETGRPEDQHMIQRLATPLGRLDEQFHLLAHGRLADIFRQLERPNRAVNDFFLLPGRCRDQAIFFQHVLSIQRERNQFCTGSALHHAPERTANQLFTAQPVFLDRRNRLAGLLRLVAQGNQRTDRVGTWLDRRIGDTRRGRQRHCTRQRVPGLEAITQLDQQSLGSLLANPRNPHQGTDILMLHGHHQLINFHARHQRQRQLRTHAIEPDQFAKQLSPALVSEGIEQLRILTHNHMGMQGYLLAKRRQLIKRAHRRIQLVTNPLHIQQNMWRLFF